MLPEATQPDPPLPHKYADLAVPSLLELVLATGARRTRLEAVLVGGAAMFQFGNGSGQEIGQRNLAAVTRLVEAAPDPDPRRRDRRQQGPHPARPRRRRHLHHRPRGRRPRAAAARRPRRRNRVKGRVRMSGFLDANEIEKLFERASEGNLPVDADSRPGRRARWLRTVDFTRPTKFTTDQERRIRRAMDTFIERSATRLVAEHRTRDRARGHRRRAVHVDQRVRAAPRPLRPHPDRHGAAQGPDAAERRAAGRPGRAGADARRPPRARRRATAS